MRFLARGVEQYGFLADGKRVVYVSKTEGLVAISPDGNDKRVLSTLPVAHFTAGRDVVVFSTTDKRVFAVSAVGGRSIELAKECCESGGAMRITPDGTSVVLRRRGAPPNVVSIRGGTERPFLDVDDALYWFTADGRVVYQGATRHAMIRDLLGGTPRDLTPALPRTEVYEIVDGTAFVTVENTPYLAPFVGDPVRLPAEMRLAVPGIAGRGRGFAFWDRQNNLLFVDAKSRRTYRVNRPLSGDEVAGSWASTKDAIVYTIQSSPAGARDSELRLGLLDSQRDHALARIPNGDAIIQTTPDDRFAVVYAESGERRATFAISLADRRVVRVTPIDKRLVGYAKTGERHALVTRGGDLHIIDL